MYVVWLRLLCGGMVGCGVAAVVMWWYGWVCLYVLVCGGVLVCACMWLYVYVVGSSID